ncbi:DUF1616 domain-containing protein [Natronococcus sp. A-GB7]|uniref:DUF1616 domain-containing protein n=1 Tax=Natronococcus sp. A-GB7 TaxID=3037649 RepID=UPI00241C9ABC|nr:DUF1616 domain-containing protein [Natronococcus sp. A-GB7]MDG5819719.1 DUF1616 domain-containing protein [Natronococcus sp. A-GB7]
MGSNGPLGSIRRLPADLAVALAVTGLVNVAAFTPVIRETPARVPFGLAFLLLVPGYVVVAALFPGRDDVDGVDRLSLSVVSSAIVVPAVGLALNATPWGIRLEPMLVGVSLLTVAVTGLATRRRLAVRPDERFRIPHREWRRRGVAAVRPNGARDLALTLSLTIAVAVAVGAVGFAVADHHGYGPAIGEDDDAAAISLLDSNGELLTDGAELEPGTTESIAIGVDNHADEERTYTVVALEQELENGTVDGERELHRFGVEVGQGETAALEHDLEPTVSGDGRLVWLLYTGDVPDEPSSDTATAHVTLSVAEEE